MDHDLLNRGCMVNFEGFPIVQGLFGLVKKMTPAYSDWQGVEIFVFGVGWFHNNTTKCILQLLNPVLVAETFL